MLTDDKVLQRCRDAVEDSILGWDGDLYESGLDSIGLLELSAALSADTGIEVLVSDLFTCATPADVVVLLRERTTVSSRS